MKTSKEIVDTLLIDYLNLNQSQIIPEANLYSDLGADSLDFIEICMALDEECNNELPESAIDEIKTVQDLYNLVDKYRND